MARSALGVTKSLEQECEPFRAHDAGGHQCDKGRDGEDGEDAPDVFRSKAEG
jgi:hypothetical protein